MSKGRDVPQCTRAFALAHLLGRIPNPPPSETGILSCGAFALHDWGARRKGRGSI